MRKEASQHCGCEQRTFHDLEANGVRALPRGFTSSGGMTGAPTLPPVTMPPPDEPTSSPAPPPTPPPDWPGPPRPSPAPAPAYPTPPPTPGYPPPAAPAYPSPPSSGYAAPPPAGGATGGPQYTNDWWDTVGAPTAPAAEGSPCQQCGAVPTTNIAFNQVTGFVFAYNWRSWKATACKDCGQALGRTVTSRTMLTGWWGFISFFGNWFAVFRNLFSLGKLARLGEPVGGDVARRADPGKPIIFRGAFLVFLALLVGAVSLVVFIATQPDDREGACVAYTSSLNAEEVGCSQPHDGKVTQVVDSFGQCPPGTDEWLEAPDGKVLCVDEDA